MRSNDGTELENIGFDVYDNWTEGAVPHVIGDDGKPRTSVIEITFQDKPIVQVRVTELLNGELTVVTRLVEPKDDQ